LLERTTYLLYIRFTKIKIEINLLSKRTPLIRTSSNSRPWTQPIQTTTPWSMLTPSIRLISICLDSVKILVKMKSNILRGTQPITNLRLITNILNPSLSTNLGLTMQPGPTHTKELPTEAPRESRPDSHRTEPSIRECSTIKKNKQPESKLVSTNISMHNSTMLKFRAKNKLIRRP